MCLYAYYKKYFLNLDSDQFETNDGVRVENMDILMICDSIGWRFTMQNCDTKVIDSYVGLMELTQLIYPGRKRLLGHDLSKYKLLILMIGRADLIILTVGFKTRLNFFMQEIRQHYPGSNCFGNPCFVAP